MKQNFSYSSEPLVNFYIPQYIQLLTEYCAIFVPPVNMRIKSIGNLQSMRDSLLKFSNILSIVLMSELYFSKFFTVISKTSQRSICIMHVP